MDAPLLRRLLALLEELGYLLLHASGDGDTAGTRVLQHTAEGVEGTVERDDVLGDTVHLDDDVGGIDLDDAGLETADGARDLGIVHHHRRGELVEAGFTDEQLVVGEIVGLYHIDLLLDLTGDLDDLVFVAPGGDGVLMHTGDAGGRHVQTLDIDLTTGKHGGDLVQDTGDILGIHQQGI